jgi:hypothetical protein
MSGTHGHQAGFALGESEHRVLLAVAGFVVARKISGYFFAQYLWHFFEKMPGIQNDPAAYAAMRLCMNEYPGGYSGVQQGEGRGFLSYKSGAENALENAGIAQRRAFYFCASFAIEGKWLHGGYMEARKQKAHSEEWAKCLNIWWPIAESNHGHADFQSAALPTELIGQKEGAL